MTFHFGVSGSREGANLYQRRMRYSIFAAIRDVYGTQVTLHHGDCTGWDAESHRLAKGFGFSVIIHPPIKDAFRAYCDGAEFVHEPLGYYDRNMKIVQASRLLVAGPKTNTITTKGGTSHTVKYARKRDVQRMLIFPDRVEWE